MKQKPEMRRVFRILALFPLCFGLLQLSAGVCVLSWAWPLFADPPILGGGLQRAYLAVGDLLAGNEAASAPLSTLRHHLFWLFDRHGEGTLVGVAAGSLLVLSGLASLMLALHGWRQGSRHTSPPFP